MDTYDTINDVLVLLFNEIWELEEKAIITEEFQNLTTNDMHVIEAIGLDEGLPMSAVAKKLNVTAGTLTASINSLVNKKYVSRQRSEKDRRVVHIKLTDKGVKAYHHHADFHHKMTDAVIKSLNEEEIPVLLKMLNGLSSFFRKYHDI